MFLHNAIFIYTTTFIKNFNFISWKIGSKSHVLFVISRSWVNYPYLKEGGLRDLNESNIHWPGTKNLRTTVMQRSKISMSYVT